MTALAVFAVLCAVFAACAWIADQTPPGTADRTGLGGLHGPRRKWGGAECEERE